MFELVSVLKFKFFAFKSCCYLLWIYLMLSNSKFILMAYFSQPWLYLAILWLRSPQTRGTKGVNQAHITCVLVLLSGL